jgi:hypothetical protein
MQSPLHASDVMQRPDGDIPRSGGTPSGPSHHSVVPSRDGRTPLSEQANSASWMRFVGERERGHRIMQVENL